MTSDNVRSMQKDFERLSIAGAGKTCGTRQFQGRFPHHDVFRTSRNAQIRENRQVWHQEQFEILDTALEIW